MNEPIKNPESVAANKYCDETVTHMIDIENMDDEAVVRNLRFMAYATGWRDSYDARQKEIDEANRWWATRWQSSHDWWNGPNGLEPSRDEYNLSDGQLKATREMDAAAKKILEG